MAGLRRRAMLVAGGVGALRAACALAGLTACVLAVPAAEAATPTPKKAIWGPITRDGVSQFPIYQDLGADIYETSIAWDAVAPTRPANPTDPNDPAYRWPTDLDSAVAQAASSGMRVAVTLTNSPAWANGGHSDEWAPLDPADFAAFAAAASRRYPGVHLWVIWGEPSRTGRFRPLIPQTGFGPLTPDQAEAPHLYARILDAAYGALKGISPQNLVIGGNTFTTGDITPLNWIRNLRLPNGHAPRMDLYGHNPFSARKPSLHAPPLGRGYADFSDLHQLARWIDRYLYPHRRHKVKLFLSEFVIPTDHANYEFNFHTTQAVAADWLTAALRIARGWPRIFTLGWFSLYDDPPNGQGTEVDRGLLTFTGQKKPAYSAFQRG